MRRLALFIALAILSGCKLDLLNMASVSPAGRYTLDMNRTAESVKALAETEAQKTQGTPEEIQKAVEEQEKQAIAFLSSMSFTMTLSEDKTWKGAFAWGPFQQNSEGTWDQQGEKLILTTLQEDGRQLAQPKVEEAIYRGGDIYLTDKAKEISTALILTRG
jgi:hypothetical protein